VSEFINKHPIVSLLFGLAALGTIEYIARASAVAKIASSPNANGGGHVGFDADLPVVAPTMQAVPGYDSYTGEDAA
jgi:hypothetical protein